MKFYYQPIYFITKRELPKLKGKNKRSILHPRPFRDTGTALCANLFARLPMHIPRWIYACIMFPSLSVRHYFEKRPRVIRATVMQITDAVILPSRRIANESRFSLALPSPLEKLAIPAEFLQRTINNTPGEGNRFFTPGKKF